jgi:hypothetical protein
MPAVSSISRFRAFYYEASGQSGGDLFFNSLKVGKSRRPPCSTTMRRVFLLERRLRPEALSNGGDVSGATSDNADDQQPGKRRRGHLRLVVYNHFGGELSSSANGVFDGLRLATITLGASRRCTRDDEREPDL